MAEETGDLSDDQQSGRHEEKRRWPQNGVYFTVIRYVIILLYQKKNITYKALITRDGESRIVGVRAVLLGGEVIDVETVAFRLAGYREEKKSQIDPVFDG